MLPTSAGFIHPFNKCIATISMLIFSNKPNLNLVEAHGWVMPKFTEIRPMVVEIF